MRTQIVQTRLDVVDLANCAAFLTRQGFVVRSQSDLLHKIVRSYALSVKLKEPFIDEVSAREFLKELGIIAVDKEPPPITITMAEEDELLEGEGK